MTASTNRPAWVREKCPKCHLVADQIFTYGKKVTVKKCRRCGSPHSWVKV